MLLIERRIPTTPATDVDLELPFNMRQKSRLRTRLADGEEVGLFLERGTILRGGDCLLANDGRIVRVVAAAEAVMRVRAKDALTLLRATYHLGNRHVPLEIGIEWLRLESDSVLAEMLIGLGATVVEETAPFEPEAGAYAGGHRHAGDNGHAGVIHYGRPP